MTAIRERHSSPKVRLAIRHSMNRHYILSTGSTFFAALPIVLVGGHGLVRAAGLVYAVVWGLFLVPSISASLGLLVDAGLILFNKRPMYIQGVVLGLYHRREDHRRVMQWLHVAARIAYWTNPLMNLTTAALLTAMRLRPNIRDWLNEFAAKHANDQQHMAAAVEYAQPAVERVAEEDPELQLAVAC